MNQQIHEEAAEWLVELRTSPSDAAARQRFDEWLATSPEHVRAYLECVAISETAAAGARSSPQELDALIERARQSSGANVVSLPAANSAGAVTSQRRAPSRVIRFGLAATVLLAVIGAGVGYITSRDVYTTAIGEQRSILLPDGSTIDLNGRSKVRVRLDARTRSVDLMEGEALFRVVPNKTRPFVVAADDARVRAVGTEFAINRRQRELVVTVVEGTVAVSAAGAGGGETLLNGGQQLALSLAAPAGGDAVPQPRSVEVNDAIAWTRRRLVFDSTPLEDVVAEFNRHSSRSLVIQGDGLEDFHISGAFSSTDVQPFLRFLRAQPGVEVIEERDRIVIVHR